MPESHGPVEVVRPDAHYVSQYPQVIFEEEDHEVVVVNLLEGTYYYLTGTAAFIWLGLHAGMTVDELTREVENHTRAPEPVLREVAAFVTHLVSLSLVSAVSDLPGEPLPAPDPGQFLGSAYTAPVIETYSDLQDILLLDPVHDVDESGWPTPRKA